MAATQHAIDLALIAADAAAEKLGSDIVLIDVSDRLALTDVFVIVTGSNERQVEAIVDSVEEKLRAVGVKPLRREGRREEAVKALGEFREDLDFCQVLSAKSSVLGSD